MRPLVATLLVTLLCGLTLTASISGEPERSADGIDSYMANMAGKSAPSQEAYVAWLRYMLRQKEQAAEEEKRMSDFSVPYLKYRQDKRNNGIWVWMPAQGYVSVPHQKEDRQDAVAKQGKIMRYGK